MPFDVDVGPSGVVVEVEGVVSRATGEPARLVFEPRIGGVVVGDHLWFEGVDALAFYLASARTGDVVRVTGRVYHYGYAGKANIEDIRVVVVGRADLATMVRMCDGTPVFEGREGQVSLINPTGGLVWFDSVAARDAALEAMYFGGSRR